MPELPEVETSRRGISPHIIGSNITNVIIRQAQLRWLVPSDLSDHIHNQTLLSIDRRAKYLLLNFESGTVLIHLGMSGSVRICKLDEIVQKHDHVDLVFNNCLLRYTDPRRFGSILWLGLSPLD